MMLAQQGPGGASVYGTPIYGEGGRVGVIPKSGGGVQWLDTGGVPIAPNVQYLNTGTGFTPADKRTGAPVAPQIPIDVSGAAAATASGKSQGEDQALLASMQSKLPHLLQTVTKLEGLADKATYTMGGQAVDYGRRQLGLDPRESAVARTEYIATVDNQVLPLLRDTFGAAFTVEEGKSLRATLGDADKSPQEKKAVLRAFIDQKIADMTALSSRVGGQMPNTTNLPMGGRPTAPAVPPRGAPSPNSGTAPGGPYAGQTFGAPQPAPEAIGELEQALASVSDPQMQEAIMQEWERVLNLGSGAAYHFLGIQSR